MTTRYVPSGGSPSYSTIKAAVQACTTNDIVEITDSSIYYETIINTDFNTTGITIQATEGQHPIIDGLGKSGNVIYSDKNYTYLKRLVIRNAELAGILIVGNGSPISECISYNNGTDGIRVTGNTNTIENNVCMYNGNFGEHGIDIDGNSNIINSNKCIGNASDGININGDTNTIKNNTCERNGVDGIDIDGENVVGNNIIDKNISRFNGGEGIEVNADIGTTTVTNNISLYNTYRDYAKSSVSVVSASNNISSDDSEDFSYLPVIDSW